MFLVDCGGFLRKERSDLVAVNAPKFRCSKTKKYQCKNVANSFRNTHFITKKNYLTTVGLKVATNTNQFGKLPFCVRKVQLFYRF